jgi:hypothetical protein
MIFKTRRLNLIFDKISLFMDNLALKFAIRALRFLYMRSENIRLEISDRARFNPDFKWFDMLLEAERKGTIKEFSIKFVSDEAKDKTGDENKGERNN